MRALALGFSVALVACGGEKAPPHAPAAPAAPPVVYPTPSTPERAEVLTADTPKTTTTGATFVAPAGWTIRVRDAVTVLDTPEADSHIALVDIPADDAKDADAAVAAAWKAYRVDPKWPLKIANDAPPKDGWNVIRAYAYQTSPNEKRTIEATVLRANGVWTVALFDVADAVAEKRSGQIRLLFGRLLPKGYSRESFAGKKAHRLDAERIAKLTTWTESAMKELAIPGVAIGLVQDGKTVFADGFGVRELGKKEKPDADTLFMIASNTKAMTTLLLAKLVDEKKIAWETPVTELLPAFKLGDPDTTRQVLVKHLVCACTGLPRQDFEWIFQYEGVTPERAMGTLADMKPTTKFGEAFQYSNLLAASGGFVGGHVLFPKKELGAAYDEAMRTRVFEPLKMSSTTFDYAKALAKNHAHPHSFDIEAKPAKASMGFNYAAIPVRPAGAAWSNVRDVLAYVQMELAEGALPSGKPYIGKAALLERRAPQVTIGRDDTYGMGLGVSTKYGTPVVHHGGDMLGFHSDMIWLPEHGVGAVVLTNGDPGWILRSVFQRKLLEVLFDGNAEADEAVVSQAKTFIASVAAERKLLVVPADPAESARLAKRYKNDALGTITVGRSGTTTTFDFGEWKTDMATRRNPDGTLSFVTISPGVMGFQFVVGEGEKKTLVLRDGQHEYVFTEG